MNRKLTAQFVENAPLPLAGKDRTYYWDAGEPGFGLMVTAKGARSWLIQYRHDGKVKRITRKDFPPLAQARADARDALTKVKRGEDPFAKPKIELTVADICANYMRLEGDKLRSRGQYGRIISRLIVPKIGNIAIGGLRRSQIVAALDDIAKDNGEVMADLTMAVMRRAMSWHQARSDDFVSPVVKGMRKSHSSERARDRVLTDDELRAIWKAACTARGAPWGLYVKFVLLTATRRMEAAAMSWNELEGDTWTIPRERYKGKVDHEIPLSAAAMAVLASLPRIGPGKFVFTLNGATPMGGISNRKIAFDEECGVKNWTLHDLRRTARTMMSRAGISPDTGERALGHKIGGIRGTYDRHSYLEEKKEAFEKLGDLVATIVGDNVVELRA